MSTWSRVVLNVNAGVLSASGSPENVSIGFMLENIIWDGTKYLAYGRKGTQSEGCSGHCAESAIYRAEGASAVAFTNDTYIHKYGDNPCGGYKRAHAANIVKVGSNYYMYHEDYFRCYAGQWSGFISRLNGTDGNNWSNDIAVLVPTSGWQACHTEYPNVIYEGGTYHMWYMAATAHPYFYSLGYANSTNGTTFVNRTRLLDESSDYIDQNNAEWSWMYHTTMLAEGGVYFQVYSKNGDIYYRISSNRINWEHKGILTVAGSDAVTNVVVFKDTDNTLYLYFLHDAPLTKTLADTLSLSDVRVCDLPYSKVLADTLTFIDARASKTAKALSDKLLMVDRISRKPMKRLVDAFALSDNIAKKVCKRLMDKLWLSEILKSFLDVEGVLWNLRDRVIDKVDYLEQIAKATLHSLRDRTIDKVDHHEEEAPSTLHNLKDRTIDKHDWHED